jgi:hypothetical protein
MSRYSEFEGYWLFGFLVDGLTELRIDLLAPFAGMPVTPHDVAIHLAAAKFGSARWPRGITWLI